VIFQTNFPALTVLHCVDYCNATHRPSHSDSVFIVPFLRRPRLTFWATNYRYIHRWRIELACDRMNELATIWKSKDLSTETKVLVKLYGDRNYDLQLQNSGRW